MNVTRLLLTLQVPTALFAMILGCQPSEAPSGAKEAWDTVNDPARLGVAAQTPFESLPLEAGLQKADYPWSGSYWPTYKGGIAHRWREGRTGSDYRNYEYDVLDWRRASQLSSKELENLSPAEKYDILTGNSGFSLTRSEKQRVTQSIRNGEIPAWYGLCDGWATAAINLREPAEAVEAKTPDGRTIKFFPSDVKALLAYAFARASLRTKYLGARCNTDPIRYDYNGRPIDSECRDANAGSFHLTLVDYLFYRKKPFIMDLAHGYKVWNQPVIAFHSRTSNYRVFDRWDNLAQHRAPQTAYLVDVETTVWYVEGSMPSEYRTGAFFDTKTFHYTLELDRSRRIVGGEWRSQERPDFLWVTNDRPKGQVGMLDFNKVMELYKASSGDQGDGDDPQPTPIDVPAKLNLVDIEWPSRVFVDSLAEANLVFRNDTDTQTPATTITFKVDPALVRFDDSGRLTLPSLSPGERAKVRATFRPGIWAGSNQIMQITASFDDRQLTPTVVSETLAVERSASLYLCHRGDCGPRGAWTRVRAGTILEVPVTFNFQSNRSLPGPFEIKFVGAGHPNLRVANNTMIATNIGGWSPNQGKQIFNFYLQIPRDLAGQKSYALFSLFERGREIHRLYVPLQID